MYFKTSWKQEILVHRSTKDLSQLEPFRKLLSVLDQVKEKVDRSN